MSNLTITVDDALKRQVIKKAKQDRFTVTFLVHQFFKNYVSDSFEFRLMPKNNILESHKKTLEDIKAKKAPLYKTGKELVDGVLKD